MSDLIYHGGCRKLIKIQQRYAEFEKYLETFDLWDEVLRRYTPLTPNSVMMEIGCGLGVPSLMLHLATRCHVYLVDKSVDLNTVSNPDWSNHSKKGLYSCDLEVTKRLFEENGAKMNKIHFIEKDEIDWDQIPPLDFVLSKSSWGVHYHLDTYWDDVTSKLEPDGRIIVNFYVGNKEQKDMMFAADYLEWLKDKNWEMTKIGLTEARDLKIYLLQALC